MHTEPDQTQLPHDQPDGAEEWRKLRGSARHQTVEVLRLILILVQDAVILVAGFAVEFAFEHWLHTEQPFFRLAISLSSAMFLLLYGVMVTVHVVHYVREQFSATAATVFGQYIPWGLAAAGVIAAVIAFNRPANHASPAIADGSASVSRSVINFPSNFQLNSALATLAISPDGKWIAFSNTGTIDSGIYLRAVNEFDSIRVPGTENGKAPFFSPDSEWIGFFANNYLKKVRVNGGVPETICETGLHGGIVGPFTGTWAKDGTIIFQFEPIGDLWKVSANGGKPERIRSLKESGEISNRWPSVLPAGDFVLFASSATNISWNSSQVAAASLKTQQRYDLVNGATMPRFTPTGHLLFVRNGTLMAQAVDSRTLELSGQPVALVENVQQSTFSGVAHYAISDNGTLVYISGGANLARRELVWVDRTGKETLTSYPKGTYSNPRFSPDGKRLAVANEELGGQIWLLDLARETMSRLTYQAAGEGAGNLSPLWTPDGSRIVFQSRQGGTSNIWWQPADGSGQAERLTSGPNTHAPNTWSPDGKTLVFMEVNRGTTQDLWTMSMDDRKPHPVMNTKFSEAAGRISPDGRWFVYASDETGRREAYLKSYPDFAGHWQVSFEGGQEAVWNPNGREIFFRNGSKMMSVEFSTRPGVALGKPKVLFDGPYLPTPLTGAQYDVSPDGSRFIMLKDGKAGDSTPEIRIVQNFFEELRQKLPTQ